MKRFDSVILKIFLYELPIILLYFISISIFGLEAAAQRNSFAKVWYDFGGCFIFGSWMAVSLCLSVRLMVSASCREKVLAKLTFLKERDEREVLLTGQAAKNTMLTTLAILLFLFCLSCFQISVYQVPPEQAVDGKSRVLSLGLQFDFTTKKIPQTAENIEKQNLLSYDALPISSSTVIICLIGWQIASYNYLMRRAIK
ncbi:hypothetical protein SOV_49160 [Sporomusa ovata DSM 2662]|uniref:Uncharacterized protein n=1 Tax=Sporomusa ovata TaxID=2378 RepID=A0A0U1L0E9_9FIRM|nr:hypothetical protein [Sporomusa ovata]EQB27290.1 hypothetical protein SOV_2c01850 [Sporomusa ovata DSM 2662]CQR73132.1 hypothetical protein SpAn4DRAFT_2364 [Sporomusa ovata]